MCGALLSRTLSCFHHRLHPVPGCRARFPTYFPTYYAPQRECQDAALLRVMQTAVEQTAAASHPILVNAKLTTWDDAVANLAAFSDEARLKQSLPADHGSVPPPRLRQISTIPRIKRCYGWLAILGKVFQELHWSTPATPSSGGQGQTLPNT